MIDIDLSRLKLDESSDNIDYVFFLFLALIVAFGTLQTTGEVLQTDKPVVTVVSPSMCPELQVGDILFVRGTGFDEVQQNDIVVYDVPDRAEFSIDGDNHSLEGEGSETNTSLGQIKLVDVVPSSSRSSDRAVMEINGEREIFTEGQTYTLEGQSIEFGYMTDLPTGDIPVVHRVIEKQDTYLETMGDANSDQIEFEKEVRPDQIHGKVSFKIPRLGLVKILSMDLIGLSGEPFVIDATPACNS